MEIRFQAIGIIHTPYKESAPYQPVEEAEDEFTAVLEPRYEAGLFKLEKFRYIYLIYYIDRLNVQPKMHVKPPWAGSVEVGLFASRSPARPNPIGLSVVKVKKVEGNVVYTSGLDVFDGTPLLDIKPYIRELDSKEDANYGWIEGLDNREHLMLHIKGIPHKY